MCCKPLAPARRSTQLSPVSFRKPREARLSGIHNPESWLWIPGSLAALAPRNDGGVCRSRRRNSQIRLSNSPRSRASISSPYRRDSSPLLFGGRGDRPHFPSLTHVRERSAGTALVTTGTFWRCRVPLYRHARLPALHRGDFLRSHRASSPDRRAHTTHVIQAAFALPFIRQVPAIQGGPLIGGGQ
jgi:hypothetical protein